MIKQNKQKSRIFLFTLVFLFLCSYTVDAAVSKNLHGYNGTDWIPISVDGSGNLEMNANISTVSWNNILDIPSGFTDNIDNSGPTVWQQGVDSIYNSTTGFSLGIGIIPTSNLHVVGDANITTNLTVVDSILTDYIYPNNNPSITLKNITILDDIRVLGNSYLGTLVFDANGTFPDSVLTDYIFSNSASSTTVDNITILKDIRVLGNSYLGSFTIEDDLVIGNNNISSTNVGIGTLTPDKILDIENAGNQLRLTFDATYYLDLDQNTISSAAQRLRLNPDSQDVTLVEGGSGNVGIGTTNPSSKLEVAGGDINVTAGNVNIDKTTYPRFRVHENGIAKLQMGHGNIVAGTSEVGTADDTSLIFIVNAAEKMRINATTGNVGIGTTNPTFPLTVQSDSGTNAVRIIGRNNAGTDEGTLTFTKYDGTTTQGYIQSSGTDLEIYSGGSGGVILQPSSGNVGIGTTSPTHTLNVDGDLNVTGDAFLGSFTLQDDLIIGSNNISSTNIGIGTTTPGYKLHVDNGVPTGNLAYFLGNNGNDGLLFGTTTTPRHFYLATGGGSTGLSFGINGDSNAMFIDTSGNVGIGTTSPTSLLHVFNGDVNFSDGTGEGFFYQDANKRVGIGTDAIPHGAIGMAKLAIDGTDASAAGPHITLTTAADDYPLMQLEPWQHDNVWINFDAYEDGVNPTRSSDAGSSFQIGKNTDKLVFKYGVAAAGTTVTMATAMAIEKTGNVGIGTTSPDAALEVVPSAEGGFATRIPYSDGSGNHLNLNYFTVSSVGGNGLNLSADLGSDILLDTTGNVGIGTTSPSNTLHVAGGGIRLDSNYPLEMGGTTTRIDGDGTRIQYKVNNADIVTMTSSNVGIGTTSPTHALNVDGNLNVSGSEIVNSHISSASIHNTLVNAAGVFTIRDTSENQIVTVEQTGNVGIGTTSPEQPLHIAKASGGLYARLNANSDADVQLWFNDTEQDWRIGLDSGSNDNDFVFYDAIGGGAGYVMVLEPTTGNVGIGTTSPGGMLDLSHATMGSNDLYISSKNAAGGAHSGVIWRGYYGGTSDFFDAMSIQRYNQADANSAANYQRMMFMMRNPAVDGVLVERMSVLSSGNVGIGTTTPTHLFNVDGTMNISGNALFDSNVGIGKATPTTRLDTIGADDSNGIIARFANSDTGWNASAGIQLYTDSVNAWNIVASRGVSGEYNQKLHFINQVSTAENIRMTIDEDGNVGIGTTSPSVPLHVKSTGVSSEQFRVEASDGSTLADFQESAGGDALLNIRDRDGTADWVLAAEGNSYMGAGFNFGIGDSTPSHTLEVTGTAYVSSEFNVSNNFIVQSGGNVGIGTTSPEDKLHVFQGDAPNVDATAATLMVLESSSSNNWINFQNAGTTANAGFVWGDDDADDRASLYFDHNTDIMYFSRNFSVTHNIYSGSRTGGAIDIAELIYSEGTMPQPGDVIIASSNQTVALSNEPYDTKVVGIVSTKPHLSMGAEYGSPTSVELALAGRVPVKVTLENGNIEVGDLLTTSSTPGKAMKCSIETQEQKLQCMGAILGKALETYDENTEQDTEEGGMGTVGSIMTLITLQ
jgi:hypothetical protein